MLLDAITSGSYPTDDVCSVPWSLRPGATLTFGCAINNFLALAIRDEWRSGAHAIVMNAEELDALSIGASTVFVGTDTDLA